MLEILFIRHGQTEWNVKHKVMGRRPMPLSDAGLLQAERLSGYLKEAGLRAIVSSPVLRALQTAEAIAKGQRGVAVETDERLSEIDYGEWVGRSFVDVANENQDLWHRYHYDPSDVELPGGERMCDVVKRVAMMLDDVRIRFGEGRVALVSHADVIKIAFLNLMGIELNRISGFSIDNCAMILIRFHPEFGPRLIVYNAMNGFGNDL